MLRLPSNVLRNTSKLQSPSPVHLLSVGVEPPPPPPSSPVRVLQTHTVKPPVWPRERIPLTPWDVSTLSVSYFQKGLLFSKPAAASAPLLSSTTGIIRHLGAALADALASYYPIAGRLVTDSWNRGGDAVGCSVSIDCDGQGVEVVHAVADGVAIADVIPPGVDVPRVVHSFFPLDGSVNHDGHEIPLLVVQVTELADGVFVGFAYNLALSDGTAFWDFLNAWAEIAQARLASPRPLTTSCRRRPLLDRWSADGGAAAPVVLPYADLSELIERAAPAPVPMRERMLHFSAESLAALKERARGELLAAGNSASAASLTRFQALSSLVWRCVTRARLSSSPERETMCVASINNRGRLQPPLPTEYFGNAICSVSTDPVPAAELLERGHGWEAAAMGSAVAAHTNAAIRAHLAAWRTAPSLYMPALRWDGPRWRVMLGSSPRFNVFGCDFGWGKAVAARSGKANKQFDGKASLYPGREGGGSMSVELVLTSEHMPALERDDELLAAVSPDVPCGNQV